MKWVVVTRDALTTWLATDPDLDVVLEVLVWLDSLPDDGAPGSGVFDPWRETYTAEVRPGGVWVEYVVLPYLPEPAIVIRRFA